MNPLAQSSPAVVTGVDSSTLEAAVLRSLAYADLFEFPLRVDELHRGLIGVRATRSQVEGAVGALIPGRASRLDGYVCLPGRERIVSSRRERTVRARALWPEARRWARAVAALPFVRMVAVTGSLARDNPDSGADVDLLVVTDPGRVWVSRALTAVVARRAARRGTVLCANYFLARDRLELDERNVYTAHELLQMVPMAGFEVHRELLAANPWAFRFLPNAARGAPGLELDREEGGGRAGIGTEVAAPQPEPLDAGWLRRGVEGLLRTPLGAALDGLERRRKRLRSIREGRDLAEARFEPGCFKGHFDGHGRRTLAAYEARISTLADEGGP